MLFIAKYNEEADIVVDARDADHAIEVLEDNGQDRPVELREMPVGVFVVELYAADGRDEEEDEEVVNLANYSQTGIAFEPLDRAAAYFAAMLAEEAGIVVPLSPESGTEPKAADDDGGGHA
jgi:hypothetical protein